MAAPHAKTRDRAVPVHIGYHDIYVKKKVKIKPVKVIPKLPPFLGVARPAIKTNTNVNSKASITPACEVVTPRTGATDANQSSQTIVNKK